jgi:hypothetical protein
MSKKGKTPPTTTPKSKKDDFNSPGAENLFNSFNDPEDTDVISMEGIGKLCESLGIDAAADIRGLVLMWKLGALSKPGQITREEFFRGMQSLNVSDIKGIQGKLPSMDPGFLERSEFRGIFSDFLNLSDGFNCFFGTF